MGSESVLMCDVIVTQGAYAVASMLNWGRYARRYTHGICLGEIKRLGDERQYNWKRLL
ncbi:MAG: hypothetical protein RSC68_02225 [Acinetobacter sp.]